MKSFLRKEIVKCLVHIFVIPYLLFSIYYPIWLLLQSDTYTKESIEKVPLCPCRVSTTWDEKQSNFTTDPACNVRKSGFWNCRFHYGAAECYRQKSTTASASAQCCYDINGRWISDWKKGAGTLDFYYPESWRNISTYQHFFSDVLSYFSCSIGGTRIFTSCKQYMRYRPAGKCEIIPLLYAYKDTDVNLSNGDFMLI
ncbi:hypothetical protein I4U23_004933 [Adineta vaga]|nr:hypothetical protein I4U23_004933 [Adineta vaga]